MDININSLQHQAAVITPSKTDKPKQPADSSIKSAADANTTQKAGTQSVSAGVSVVDETKAAKKSDDLKQAVGQLNDYVQNMQRDLQFSIDKDSGITVVKVIDTKSEKVIRQIPSEEALKLARSLAEQSDGMAFAIFSSKA
jgi:flagellar protein FlaG